MTYHIVTPHPCHLWSLYIFLFFIMGKYSNTVTDLYWFFKPIIFWFIKVILISSSHPEKGAPLPRYPYQHIGVLFSHQWIICCIKIMSSPKYSYLLYWQRFNVCLYCNFCFGISHISLPPLPKEGKSDVCHKNVKLNASK